MNKNELLELAKDKISALYTKHKSVGIEAIYIWGSIARSDFDIESSDIDIICIVNDSFPLDLNEKLRDELTESAPEREWGFQIIYLDELNGGQIRSRIAKAMSPQSILPSYPEWTHVCGRKFQRSDFSVQDASAKERMRLNIGEIKTRLSRISSDDEYRKVRDRKGIIKAALFLIHNRQLNRGEDYDLNYNELLDHSDGIEASVLSSLIKIKNDKIYDESFSDYIEEIVSFTAQIEQELSEN